MNHGIADPAQIRPIEVSFISPNEWNVQTLTSNLNGALSGAYAAVGTERGFFAISSGKFNRLILFDRDPAVTTYNRINRALIAASKDRTNYLRLRQVSSYEEIKAASKRCTNPEDAKF